MSLQKTASTMAKEELPPVDKTKTRRPGPSAKNTQQPKISVRKRLRRDLTLLLLLTPGLLFFLIFQYWALGGYVIAFQDYVPFLGIEGSDWVGLENFQAFFGGPAVWQAVRNTLQISALQLIFFFPAPIALAIFLHSVQFDWARKIVQSIVYLPHFISWVIVVALFQQVLGPVGVVNGWLSDAGLSTIDVIGNPSAFQPLMVAQLIWKDCGWGMIIFLAALYRVDEQLYEAAAIDGAGWWRRLWHVTLPSMRPIIVLLFILKLGDILTVGFEQIFLQRNAVGPEAAEVLDTFVYFSGVIDGNWGYATAVGLLKGIIAAVLVYLANKAAHKLGEQGLYR
ncbi:ABC transporter permease subunit [Paenarthrobacter sp. OM7]|uniref:ABC transporter permease n=1 Tax=Paenarthrobacter sp. OM7 TaxID=3041264 RepID=UPI002469ACC9|nr:ABC transporter permease subunit [Paenarthrobacter sp. OM7]WGM20267.1 ABC transporter permease subunit [Paenarthrobacter sp. OM7]